MPWPTNYRMTEKPSLSTDSWMAAEMSDTCRPSRICSRPLTNDRSAAAMSLSASGLVRPTGTVRAAVAVETLEEDSEIEADDVALLEDAARGDAVNDLLVDRDADRGRVAAVALEGRDGPELPGPLLRVEVEVPRPQSRPDERLELAEDGGHDAAALAHGLDLGRGLEDDHRGSRAPLARSRSGSRTRRTAAMTDPAAASASIEWSEPLAA